MKTFLALVVMLCACGMQRTTEVRPIQTPTRPNPVPPIPGSLDFVRNVRPIVDDNCALSGCHANAPFLQSEKEFVDIGSVERISNNSMPPSYSPKYKSWSDEDKALILTWYSQRF